VETGFDDDVEFAPWDGRRVPVTLVGGYLGAGKTTVINRLLARTDRPIAVLVNDVGEIAIDHRLVARRHTDAIELTDGCVCCSLSQGLAEAFDGLRTRPRPPDHVIIELSGVADPTRVIPWARSAGFRLDAVVALVDAGQFTTRLEDPRVGPLLARQLEAADLVLVTKTDLVDPGAGADVVARVTTLVGDRPVLASTGPEAVAALLDTGTRRPGGVAATPPPTLFDAHRATVVPLPDPIDRPAIDTLLEALDPRVVRAKGVARTPQGDRLLIQVVGRRREVTPLPAAEDQDTTDLVVISLV
jgi:G3E family GTPase